MNTLLNPKFTVMKKLIIILVFLLPFSGYTQAHLGATIYEIKAMHPDNSWEVNYADDGTKYISTDMTLGYFAYFLDKEGLTSFCIQIPFNLVCLNTQIEIYNKKYVITSKTSWTAYLEGGGIMNISLDYNDEKDFYCFYYTSSY